jgi:hypothetical protein
MTHVPSEFRYQHDFDKHGVFYYLGTRGYTHPWQNADAALSYVTVFSNANLVQGTLSDLIGRFYATTLLS